MWSYTIRTIDKPLLLWSHHYYYETVITIVSPGGPEKPYGAGSCWAFVHRLRRKREGTKCANSTLRFAATTDSVDALTNCSQFESLEVGDQL